MIQLGAIGALLMGLAQTGFANSPISCGVTVVGQSNSSIDVPAVNAAVNQPPVSGEVTVCLSGVFDFGSTVESVVINPGPTVTALHIVGVNATSGAQATIRNGILPVIMLPPATLPSLTIENLRFEKPAFAAVSILTANGYVRVSGLQIVASQTYLDPDLFNLTFREGIVVSSVGPVTGEVDITNNFIDGGTYSAADQALVVSAGIELVGQGGAGNTQPFTAQVRVAGNRLSNWSGSGISALSAQNVTIEKNAIDPGRFANLSSGCQTNGAGASNGIGSANGIGLANVTNFTVRDNIITLVPSLTGSGAPPACTAALIVSGTAGSSAKGNLVYHNQILGVGSYGMVLGTVGGATDGSTETDNVFALNSVFGFAARNAALYLGPEANGNVLVGFFPSLAGNTAGNVVINGP